jgi:CheY-like chemotaxis protein
MRQTPSEGLAREVIQRDVPETVAALERWALGREKILGRLDVRGAKQARGFMAELVRTSRKAERALESGDRAELLTHVAALGALLRQSAALLASGEASRVATAHEPLAPAPVVRAPAELGRVERPPALRVLLVDDDPSIRIVADRALRRVASVETVGTAAEARARLAHASFDAIVCDLELPDARGDTLLAEVAASNPDVLRVLFTGAEGQESEALVERGVCHEVRYKSGGVAQLATAVSADRSRAGSGVRARVRHDEGAHATKRVV